MFGQLILVAAGVIYMGTTARKVQLKVLAALPFLILLGLGITAKASPIVTDFEGLGLAEGALVTNQIAGVTFEGAILVKPGGPEFGFTNNVGGVFFDTVLPGESFAGDFISDVPVGGDPIVAGIIGLLFDVPINDLRFYVADIDSGIGFSDVFTAKAFNTGGSLIETIVVTAGSPSTGDGVATPIAFAAFGISRVELTLDDGRGRGGWGVDHLSFTPVPEPTSVAIWLLLGLTGLAYGIRRRGQGRKSKPALAEAKT